MKLTARLQAIAEMVPQGSRLADIGSDHAYLPVWLLQQGKILSAIASDIAEGPLRAAENTVCMSGLGDKIGLRQGDGLAVLEKGEADCIVIAGMGAPVITGILERDMEKAKAAKRLILQPMRGAASLRRWLSENGWKLAEEGLAEEGPRLYEIIAAERGKGRKYSPAEYEAGPLLLSEKHPLFFRQLEKKISALNALLSEMEKSGEARQGGKYRDLENLLRDMEVLRDERNRK